MESLPGTRVDHEVRGLPDDEDLQMYDFHNVLNMQWEIFDEDVGPPEDREEILLEEREKEVPIVN